MTVPKSKRRAPPEAVWEDEAPFALRLVPETENVRTYDIRPSPAGNAERN